MEESSLFEPSQAKNLHQSRILTGQAARNEESPGVKQNVCEQNTKQLQKINSCVLPYPTLPYLTTLPYPTLPYPNFFSGAAAVQVEEARCAEFVRGELDIHTFSQLWCAHMAMQS